MDVLIEFAASLRPDGDADCRLLLIEHLAARRKKAATKLFKTVSANEKSARSLLKLCSKSANRGLDTANSSKTKEKSIEESRQKSADSMATSLQIEQELRQWPSLTASNIHPFRLKVKNLRYVLQLGQNSNAKPIAMLGEVKDQIGLWHDWNELAAISSKVLDHGAGCPIAAQIRSRTREELNKALESANSLRAIYLPNDSGRSRRKGFAPEIHPVWLKTASHLAS